MFKANLQETIRRIQSKRNPPITEEQTVQKAKDNFMKPFIEILILSRLSKSDSYGYAIIQSIKTHSGSRFQIPEGTMYPTLYRMIKRGYIMDYRSPSAENQLRISYKITPAGHEHLKKLMEAYGEAQKGYRACLSAMESNASTP